MQNKIKTKVFAVIGLSVLGGVFLMHSDSVSAYSLTVTTSGSVTADVIPAADGGIGTTVVTDNVNIVSNCRAGYTMTIAGSSDNNLYLNGDDTNNTTGTYFTPVDGTSALNASANANKWGYSLTANSRTGVFTALSSTAATLKTPAQTASPDSDIDTTIPVYYGTSVNNDMAPGNYTFSNSNSVTYSVVMDTSCTMYSIQYDGSNPDNPNGMGTTDSSTGVKSVRQVSIVEGIKLNLLAPNFKKAGYGFLGWSTDSDAYIHFTDNDTTNDPIIYGPNEDVIMDADLMAMANSRNIITMYAVWMPALKGGNNNPVYMQEWDNPNTNLPHDGCSTLTQTIFDDTVTDEKGKIIATKDSVVALTDKRDNMIYTVARLADGNCWMMENLRLDNQYTMGQNQNDSSVTNQYLSQGYGDNRANGYGRFLGLADPETNTFTNVRADSNSLYKSDGSGDIYDSSLGTLEDIGGGYDVVYNFPRYKNVNTGNTMADSTVSVYDYTDPSDPTVNGVDYNGDTLFDHGYGGKNLYSYGNYYTWTAAIANTYRYYSATGRSGSDNSGTSICPSGWVIPTAGSLMGDYSILSQEYGGTGNEQNGAENDGDTISNRLRSFPNNSIYSGYVTVDSQPHRGNHGGVWSRSSNHSYSAFHLSLNGARVVPSQGGNNKEMGRSVRCLAGASNIEIVLDSNNGTNYFARVYGKSGDSIPLTTTTFSKENYTIGSWNTASDGSGTPYASSFTVPAGSTGEVLYAQWVPQYKITYENNCMSWASGDSNCTAADSVRTSIQKINLDGSGNGSGTLAPYNKFTLTGWKIKEWTTNTDGSGTAYPVSSTYSVIGASAGDGITLYAHWVPTYTVQYDGNGSDNDATGMGSTDASTGLKSVKHTEVAEGDTFDLFASNFKKAGYGFVGWSTDSDAWTKLTDNDTSNNAKIWGPNEAFTAPAYNGTPITTLYAIWAPAETSGGNPVYLQNWTGCSAMTATTYDTTTGTLTVAKDSITALTDQRDNQVYTIAKLADENCWMVENLRLDNTPELSTTNTNINSNNSTLPITNEYGSTTSNYLSATSNSWCTTNYSAACDDQSRLNTTNTIANITPSQTQNVTSANTHADFDNTIYSYGNYYNWYSATAGYGTYSRTTSEPTAGDLCPAGWKLPYGNTGTSGTTNIGGTKGGFSYLDKQMGGTGSFQTTRVASNKWRMFPNNFIYSGFWLGSSASYRGMRGYYWSASAFNSSYAYYLYFYNNVLNPGYDSYSKYSGYSVRCVSGS